MKHLDQNRNQDLAVQVVGLRKSYGSKEAVKGISFEVRRGELFGLLGPNGAGKSTTLEILQGLRERTAGEVSVLGLDPQKQSNALKRRIGSALQMAPLPDRITVQEAVTLEAALYGRKDNCSNILFRLRLDEHRNVQYRHLSGGQKQRLVLALSLVNDPEVVFWDEPTAGLDPEVRLEIHRLIESLREDRRTVILCTHYLEEAELLCDHVALIDQGVIRAAGTPRELISEGPAISVIELALAQPFTPGWTDPELGNVEVTTSNNGLTVMIRSRETASTVAAVMKRLAAYGVSPLDIGVKRPSLESVYLAYTERGVNA